MLKLLSGTAHAVPTDMRAALLAAPTITEAWNDLTPLARNEWICWTISVKNATTREKHIKRLTYEITQGKRRPCCWPGCPHR